jgi:hypothetical protein
MQMIVWNNTGTGSSIPGVSSLIFGPCLEFGGSGMQHDGGSEHAHPGRIAAAGSSIIGLGGLELF